MASPQQGPRRIETSASGRTRKGAVVWKKSCLYAPDFPFHISRYIHANTQETPLHRHEFIELVYVWGGNAIHHVEGRRSRLHKGDVFVLSRRRKHRYVITPPETLEIINCLFLPALINPHLSSLKEMKGFIDFGYIQPAVYPHRHRLRLVGMEDLKVRNILQDMLAEFTSKEKGWQIFIRAKLVELLVILGRNYEGLTAKDSNLSLRMERHRRGVLRAIEYLDEHYDKKIRLEEVAQTVGMSRPLFCAVFKGLTGKTFVEYLLDVRLSKAAEFLVSTDLKITEVCYRVGFNNLSYFDRAFSRAFDIRPGLYRKRERVQK